MLNFLKKYSYFIIFIFYFIVNQAVLDNLPFGIDFQYWQQDVTHIKNPLLSWLPWSNYYKSWPLTYTVLWTYIKFFGDSVVFLRVINLLIHFFNFVLFQKIASHYLNDSKKVWFVSILFLISPLSTLTIVWAFQLKTVLGFFFFLLTIWIVISKPLTKKFVGLMFVTFYLSLTSKILGIFFPLFFIKHHFKKIKEKKVLFISITLLSISLLQGLLNLKGITYFVTELKRLQGEQFTGSQKISFKMSELPAKDRVTVNRDTMRPTSKIYSEIAISTKGYLGGFNSFEKLRDKHIVATQNLGRLLLSSLGLYDSLPFYESHFTLISNPLLYLYTTIGVVFFIYLIKTRDDLLFISFLLFLPIAGYIYVPYMKYSYSSDHWFYASSAFILLGLMNRIRKPLFWNITAISIISSFSFNLYKYSNFEGLLVHNFRKNQNKVALDTTIFYSKLRNQHLKTIQTSRYLLDNFDFKNEIYYKYILQSSLRLNDKTVPNIYFGRIASDRIKNQNELLLDRFLIYTKPFIREEEAILTKSMTAFNKNFLSNETYEKITKILSNKVPEK